MLMKWYIYSVIVSFIVVIIGAFSLYKDLKELGLGVVVKKDKNPFLRIVKTCAFAIPIYNILLVINIIFGYEKYLEKLVAAATLEQKVIDLRNKGNDVRKNIVDDLLKSFDDRSN